jgi:hypothetical protein
LILNQLMVHNPADFDIKPVNGSTGLISKTAGL